MKELKHDERNLLRNVFRERIGFVNPILLGPVMDALDDSMQRYNRLVAVPGVTRKCSRCGRRSVRGRYADGKRRWFCPDCWGEREKP